VTLHLQVSLNWTAVSNAHFRNFKPGQVLAFHRAVKGLSKNEAAEVVRMQPDGIVTRTSAAQERRITSRQSKRLDVMEVRPIEVAPGDSLLLTSNRPEPGPPNHQWKLTTVSAVDSAGRIQLKDGRNLPANIGACYMATQ
jgi:hypothetical protein